jgi:uncharacterized protein YifE (UPF0438 family)
MKKIALTQNQFAFVDDEDYEYLAQWKWFAHRKNDKTTYYAVRTCREKGQKTIRMHNCIAQRYIQNNYSELDHIDRNGLNNQKINLRVCTRSENLHNTSNYGKYSKGVRRVEIKYKTKDGKEKVFIKYQARIQVDKKSKSLGYFEKEVDAENAYKQASKKYYFNND